MPDSLSKQPPRSDQEDDGEHEQAWNEQKISANQVILFLSFGTGYKNEYLFIISMNKMKMFTFSRFTETVLF